MDSHIELEETETDRLVPNIDERPVGVTNYDDLKGKLNLNNGVEDLLNVLDDETSEDFDLEMRTEDGNTLLHCVTQATVDHPEGTEFYMQLVDRITEKSVIWWYKKEELPPPNSGGDIHEKYKHDAMKYLLTEPLDNKNRNVWKLAFETVSVAMIEKLMYLEGVTCCKKPGKICFDVSYFTKYLGFSFYNLFESAVLLYYKHHVAKPGLEELLERAKLKNKVADVLRIEPIRKIINKYSSFTERLNVFIVFVHILYMSLFSFVSCEIMDSTKPNHSESSKVVIYSFGLIEPIILSFYLFNEVFKCIGVLCCFDKFDRTDYMKKFSFRFPIVLVYTVLLCLLIASVDQAITTRERYILSICLLMGWLLTLSIADGIQSIHFFFKLVVTVIVKDVVKILLVYMIFLIGFSLAIHVQFLSSSNITSTYKTPIHTMYLMFNVMIGMEEAVSDSTEEYLEVANSSPLFSKILYILYVLCSSIILLNLLIAMMNTSYSKIRDQHSYEWVCDTARFGIKAAEYFPVLARNLGVTNVEYGKMFKNKEIKEDVWYIELPDLQRNEEEDVIDGPTNTDMRQVDSNAIFSENDLKSQITKLISTQQDMMSGIQRLEIQLSTLTGTGKQDRHMTVNEAQQA